GRPPPASPDRSGPRPAPTTSGATVPAAEDAGTSQAGCGTVEQQVSQVMQTTLDSLSPAERAVFLPDAVSRKPSVPGAEPVARSRPEWGELGDRVRRRMLAQRRRPSASEHDAIVRAVRLACLTQDAELLASVLARDSTAFFDGGGKVRALVRPVHGGEPVARSLVALMGPRGRTTLVAQSVNGRTGLVARYDRTVAAVISFDVLAGRVTRIWVTLNPDKLRTWNRPPSGH
ncbi:sigma-70 family RNA polymerase sigma factor family protein, partial [Actinacidiphila rubida]|uniref:RNA polymerase subunit sigma n=1 Tax=Actinacidiphila rubida TaxID=310780 RepID=UPI001C403560